VKFGLLDFALDLAMQDDTLWLDGDDFTGTAAHRMEDEAQEIDAAERHCQLGLDGLVSVCRSSVAPKLVRLL